MVQAMKASTATAIMVLLLNLASTQTATENDIVVTVRLERDSKDMINILFSDELFRRFYECLCLVNVICSAHYLASDYPNYAVDRVDSLLLPGFNSYQSFECYRCKNDAINVRLTCQGTGQVEDCSDGLITSFRLMDSSCGSKCMKLVWTFLSEGICFYETPLNVEYCDSSYACPAVADSRMSPETRASTARPAESRTSADLVSSAPISRNVAVAATIIAISGIIVAGFLLWRCFRRTRRHPDTAPDFVNAPIFLVDSTGVGHQPVNTENNLEINRISQSSSTAVATTDRENRAINTVSLYANELSVSDQNIRMMTTSGSAKKTFKTNDNKHERAGSENVGYQHDEPVSNYENRKRAKTSIAASSDYTDKETEDILAPYYNYVGREDDEARVIVNREHCVAQSPDIKCTGKDDSGATQAEHDYSFSTDDSQAAAVDLDCERNRGENLAAASDGTENAQTNSDDEDCGCSRIDDEYYNMI